MSYLGKQFKHNLKITYVTYYLFLFFRKMNHQKLKILRKRKQQKLIELQHSRLYIKSLKLVLTFWSTMVNDQLSPFFTCFFFRLFLNSISLSTSF